MIFNMYKDSYYQLIYNKLKEKNNSTFIVQFGSKTYEPVSLLNKEIEETYNIKETMENVLVIYDDKDLPVGKIRLRQQGSAGGHKGIKSIMECTFNQDFNRIRVGIGKDERIPIIQWVLSKFRQEEMDDLNQAIEQASMAAYNAIDHSFDWVMNRYNKK